MSDYNLTEKKFVIKSVTFKFGGSLHDRRQIKYEYESKQILLGPVPSSRVKLTRRLTFDLTLG